MLLCINFCNRVCTNRAREGLVSFEIFIRHDLLPGQIYIHTVLTLSYGSHIHVQGLNKVSIVPADGLAQNGARPSAGTMLTTSLDMIFFKVCLVFNSSPPSAVYMHQWIRSALLQIMACWLFGAKPLSKPMLGYLVINWHHACQDHVIYLPLNFLLNYTDKDKLKSLTILFSLSFYHLKLKCKQYSPVAARYFQGILVLKFNVIISSCSWALASGWRFWCSVANEDIMVEVQFRRDWKFIKK